MGSRAWLGGRRLGAHPGSLSACSCPRCSVRREPEVVSCACWVHRMFLAGIPVRAELILELARLVDDEELANKLERAYAREVKVLAPETIIQALDDPPVGLKELRAVLLQEHAWRQRQGLG
jgi:hypothetical protein